MLKQKRPKTKGRETRAVCISDTRPLSSEYEICFLARDNVYFGRSYTTYLPSFPFKMDANGPQNIDKYIANINGVREYKVEVERMRSVTITGTSAHIVEGKK